MVGRQPSISEQLIQLNRPQNWCDLVRLYPVRLYPVRYHLVR